MIGVPGPRLSPEFFPVIESTELGRSLPRRVASAMASRITCVMAIWFAPTGTLISKVGIPVSWQMAPSTEDASSMFTAMICMAWDALVSGASLPMAAFIASRTSGGRLVDVCVINSTMLSKKAVIMRRV